MLPVIAMGAGLLAKKALPSIVRGVGGLIKKSPAFVKKVGTTAGRVAIGAGAAATGIEAARNVFAGRSGLPALSGVPMQMPAIGGVPAPSQMPRVGTLPMWRGPGGKFQLPWQDPNIAGYLKQFALDDAYLQIYYRAPRGYVVVRDPQGRPFAILKSAARYFGLWHPHAKPPISVRDWHSFQAARKVEKKLRKIAGPALRKHGTNFTHKKLVS